jgi:hypothetical protein
MKRISASLVFGVLLLSNLVGCKALMDTTPDKQPIKAPPLTITQKTAPVQPDEITPSNARSKARQLLEEIESEDKR